MSYKATGWVWEHATQTGSERLALLALADKCNDEGECYPGVNRIANMVGVKHRRMQQILRKLETDGVLKIDYESGLKTKTGNTNRYTILPYVASLESDGVQSSTSPGVQSSTSELSVELSVKEKDSAQPDGSADAASNDGGNSNITDLNELQHGETVIEPDELQPTATLNAAETAPEDKSERKPNPWYDAVADVFDLHGGRNYLMGTLLGGFATRNGHKDYNLPDPLTEPEQILRFGRWWKADHEGLNMVQSPAKVQSEVMGWQAKGCPDAKSATTKPHEREGFRPIVPPGGYVIG